MTKPDLSNAQPGDVYQGPDGRLWSVGTAARSYATLFAYGAANTRPLLLFPENPDWYKFKKVE